jgi:CheY-like chemotaxis protein
MLDDAINGAVRGAELTRRLLAFARRQPLAPKLAQIGSVLEAAGLLFRRTLGEDVTLTVRVNEGLWPIMIDLPQLESALLNLSVNARDAMPGGGSITIEARNVTLDAGAEELNPEAAPGDYVAISVSDTGTGMPPETIAKAFDPFFTTKGTKGTGLGLSMVHGFIKQSGGHTRIYSELGRGTVIRLYLPRAAEAEREDAGGHGRGAAATGTEVVLVVEDNEPLREVAIRRLRALGYQTIAAGTGAEALNIIRGGIAIDLLFSDIVMPGGMDGRALADAALKLRPNLKVLFTSGFSPAAASAAMANNFGSNLLTKPYRKNDLAQHVRSALDRSA